MVVGNFTHTHTFISVCMCECVSQKHVGTETEKGIGYSAATVTDSCEPLDVILGNLTQFLWKGIRKYFELLTQFF